jgi:hypothetical protein
LLISCSWLIVGSFSSAVLIFSIAVASSSSLIAGYCLVFHVFFLVKLL